jgi:hypothetical protein
VWRPPSRRASVARDARVLSSVKARRKQLRELMDELAEQAENITSGLYFALCEELRKSYDAAGAAEPRKAWDDPELLLPMV